LTNEQAGYLTISQFLEYFPMGRSSLYRIVGRGELPIIKVGRSSFLSKADVIAWEAKLPRKSDNDNRR